MTNKFTKGFTLIETLVAVLILMLAIVGPLTIASKGLQVTLVAKDQEVAFYLAQDAVEYVRYVRDTNKLTNHANGWLAGLNGSANGYSTVTGANGCASSGGTVFCYINSLQDSITTCTGPCPLLRYDSANNFYTYASGGSTADTIFRRTISIKTTGSPATEALLKVVVSWSDTNPHSVTVNEVLFDWQ